MSCNLNPLATPFIPAQKNNGDHAASPAREQQPQSSAIRSELRPMDGRVPKTADGRVPEIEDYFTPVEGIWPNCGVLEPFPYYVDPISGQVFMSDPPAPKPKEGEDKDKEDGDEASRPVDVNMVLRLPLVLKLVLVYKITRAKPYRIFTSNIFVHSDACTQDTDSMIHDVIRDDMREAIKNDDIPFKDRNAFGCGRVDFKAKVLKQGADVHAGRPSFLNSNQCLWFALAPNVREKLARGQKVEDRDVSLRVTVTVFEGFPIRRLFGVYQ